MCEFCAEHGEGKKWYLQMKNYSQELRNARLTPAQQEAAGFKTRGAWLRAFFTGFVQHEGRGQSRPRPATEEEIVRRSMIVHFGQIIPLKDVEEILDFVTSITRTPCGC